MPPQLASNLVCSWDDLKSSCLNLHLGLQACTLMPCLHYGSRAGGQSFIHASHTCSQVQYTPSPRSLCFINEILFLRKGTACSQSENRDWHKRENPNYNTVTETCFLQDGSSLWCMSHEIQRPYMALPWPEVPSLCSVFLLFSSCFLQAIAVTDWPSTLSINPISISNSFKMNSP